MPTFKKEIAFDAKNELQAQTIQAALQTIAQNITPENLALLAEKSKKIGINSKIQAFKNFI